MPESALSKMRAMECDWGNGVVVKGAKYPARDNLSSV